MPRWMSVLLSAALIVLVGLTLIRLWRVAPVQRQETIALEQWVYLSDLNWKTATTGWRAIASNGLPAKDKSFSGGPIRLGGESYSKGLGTYPISEIVFAIDPDYERFESLLGIDDELPRGSGGAEFFVFLDDDLVFRSGVMRAGDAPKSLSEPVAGAGRLRLMVSDESNGAVVNSADWAEARFVRRIAGEQSNSGSVALGKSPLPSPTKEVALRESNSLSGRAASDIASWQSVPVTTRNGVTAGYNSAAQELLMSNGRLAVTVGYGGSNHGLLTVYHLPLRKYVAYQISPGMRLPSGKEFRLSADTTTARPAYMFSAVSDEVLGDGRRLIARFLGQSGVVTLRISLFDGQPYLAMRMSYEDPALGGGPVQFRLIDGEPGGFLVGDEVEYLTDYSRLRHGVVPDDGVIRKEAVSQGSPVFVWSGSQSPALIFAALEETSGPTVFSVVNHPGTALKRLRLETAEWSGGSEATRRSPRVYLEIVDSDDPRTAFDRFKNVMARIAPAPPLPSWVKYQWLSWYVYYMDINEDVIRRQIDYIAENLADLGTWNILVDAGWYVAEGRDGSDFRHVDRSKFPSGLRRLVDYAHSRGVKVVLYISTPYIDSRTRWGDWLGLGTLIKEHPEWLLPLGSDLERKSYVLDYSNAGAREYVMSILRDFFIKYDVDGIKIDGLGNADGALTERGRVDNFGLVDRLAGQTLEIYRFFYETATSLKKEVYLESGWMTPILANRYAHTFRFGDEYPSHSNSYPAPGLVEHVDYAVLQKLMFGQRPNMGAVWGDPNASMVNLWWLQAGVALGTQTVLSFDLPAMTNEALSQYRAILAHYNAFDGRTVYDRSLHPSYFATTVGPLTYLGMLGRDGESKPIRLTLGDIGLDDGQEVVAYDVSANRFFRPRGRIRTELRPETFRLYVIRSSPGVVWTNSSLHNDEATASYFRVEVRGPRVINGFAHIYAPELKAVFVDDRPLRPSLISMADEEHYTYDTRTGIVTLRYDHDKPHVIRVEYR